MNYRPLGITKEIVSTTGLEVTYAYDDLVFVEHSPFLIQFDDETPTNLKLFFNIDCEADAAKRLEEQLTTAARAKEYTILNSGKFTMVQKEGAEEFDVRFFE
jgi:hypothetical protein